MYVAVKGGEKAIRNAHRLLADKRRGRRELREIETAEIEEQLALAVDRVMSEGSLYDRRIASLAIKQARGDEIGAQLDSLGSGAAPGTPAKMPAKPAAPAKVGR